MTPTTIEDIVSEAQEIPGWMNADELAWLAGTATHMLRVVEVGCWQGRTSKVLANAVGGDLVCVDNFVGDGLKEFPITGDDLERRWRDHLDAELELKKVSLIRAPSLVAASRFRPGSVDMVFIDGDHVAPAPKYDMQAWEPAIRPGGVLCGHDADQLGVHAALVELQDRLYEISYGPGTIWSVVVG